MTAFINWNTWPKIAIILTKLAMVPVIVGIGFEFLMIAGKHPNPVTKALSAPGLWMQRITTKEPDESQLEVALAALKCAMPGEFPDERAKYEEKEEAEEPESGEGGANDIDDESKAAAAEAGEAVAETEEAETADTQSDAQSDSPDAAESESVKTEENSHITDGTAENTEKEKGENL